MFFDDFTINWQIYLLPEKDLYYQITDKLTTKRSALLRFVAACAYPIKDLNFIVQLSHLT